MCVGGGGGGVPDLNDSLLWSKEREKHALTASYLG